MMRPSNALPVVYLCREPVDFRKGINGLAILVEEVLGEDPFSEHLFVFCNRSRNRIKILYWERSGFCLWQKRLEKARFYWPRQLPDDIESLKALVAEQAVEPISRSRNGSIWAIINNKLRFKVLVSNSSLRVYVIAPLFASC